jgi:hypothetical protein
MAPLHGINFFRVERGNERSHFQIEYTVNPAMFIISDARFEAFTAADIQIEVFWILTPRSVVVACNMDFWNVAILPQHYMASQPRRL